MIISINQPAYLPWLGYFNRIAKSDIHIVLDHVQFEKNSVTNRNKILLNKEPLCLTIPVLTKGKFENLSIDSLEVDQKVKWQKKHFASIFQAYSKSLFWNEIHKELEFFYHLNVKNLNSFLSLQMMFFTKYLGVKTPVYFSKDYKFKEKKSDLVLEICHKFKATTYLSGPFGRDYLELNKFSDLGINVIFEDYQHPEYPQKSDRFYPYLSTLDLMINCGKNSLKVLENV
jgi:hypothetical protein